MERRNAILLIVVMALGALGIGLQAADEQNAKYTVRILALPDHGQGNITMDYIAYDPKTGYVWIPAINIGSVDVVDTSNGSVREISGFATKELEFEVKGRKRAQGPSGVSIGDGVVYIGDRADSSVCAVDEKTLARKSCGHIDSTPDGVVYVAPTKEVWVTAPSDNSVRILDSQTLNQKEKLTFDGRPEGYAVDAKRGRLYMNYEDKDLTTAIDLRTHKTMAKWQSSCGEGGPNRSVDQDAGYRFVACNTRAEVLDAGHNGEKLSSIDTGDGVDDPSYSPATHMLYVGGRQRRAPHGGPGGRDRQAERGCSGADPRGRSQQGRHESWCYPPTISARSSSIFPFPACSACFSARCSTAASTTSAEHFFSLPCAFPKIERTSFSQACTAARCASLSRSVCSGTEATCLFVGGSFGPVH